MEFCWEIATVIENKEYEVGVFLDLKKASDTVNHDSFKKNYKDMEL